jgi:hypothetical protein
MRDAGRNSHAGYYCVSLKHSTAPNGMLRNRPRRLQTNGRVTDCEKGLAASTRARRGTRPCSAGLNCHSAPAQNAFRTFEPISRKAGGRRAVHRPAASGMHSGSAVEAGSGIPSARDRGALSIRGSCSARLPQLVSVAACLEVVWSDRTEVVEEAEERCQ